MLHELSISSLGVIDAARVEFGPGLTALTGETGAGKTMVLTGVALILGGKPTPDAVRVGADEAVAEAVVDLPEGSPARAAAEEAGVIIDDDGTTTMTRIVGAQTRSRAVVGGRTVPSALLAQMGQDLVTVHGQADQVRLRTASRQRATLDEYAGAAHGDNLRAYREAWAAWREATATLERLEASEDAERARLARLADDLAALTEADVQVGERAAVAARIEVLSHAEQLREAASRAHEALVADESPSAVSALDAARREMEQAAHTDPELGALATRLAEYLYGAQDAALELASYLDRVDGDPAALETAQQRLAAITALERRLGAPADDLPAIRDRLEADAAQGVDWDSRVAVAREVAAQARTRLEEWAGRVTDGRTAAAGDLAAKVGEELSALAMPQARIEVAVRPTEAGPSGADEVQFLLASHDGAPMRPLADAASGGELSRLMLAVEVALSGEDAVPRTFVFDEVDAGVGGKAAQAVGQRLAALARRHQVIVVTHLAQVAAYADRHVVVAKSSDGSVTRSHVGPVDGNERVTEVARLLSGEEDSSTARAHAVELLEGARVAR